MELAFLEQCTVGVSVAAVAATAFLEHTGQLPMTAKGLNTRVNNIIEGKKDPKNHLHNTLLPFTQKTKKGERFVYEDRSVTLACFYAMASICFVVRGMHEYSWKMVLGCFLFTAMQTDLHIGFMHIMYDNPENGDKPLIGNDALTFQWHHFIPRDVFLKSFPQAMSELNPFTTTFCVFPLILFGGFGADKFNCMIIGMHCLWVIFGQYSHYAAHTPASKRTKAQKFMQRVGLMIDPHKHAGHHSAMHLDIVEDFCILGYMDWIVNRLVRAINPLHNTNLYIAICAAHTAFCCSMGPILKYSLGMQ